MKAVLLLAMISGAANLASAQPPEPVPQSDARPPYLAARVTRLSASPMSSTVAGATALETFEEQLQVGLLRAGLGSYSLDIGIDYQYTRYEYTGIESRNRDLHRLQLPFRLRGRTGQWRIDAGISPGVSTSSNVFQDPFGRWTGDDVVVSAFAEGRSAINPDWYWIAGIAHDRTFGTARTYPVAGIGYTGRRGMSLRLALPDPELKFAPTARQQWTARIYPAGHRWHVVSDTLNRDFDYRMRALRGEVAWSLQVWRGIHLDLAAGYESRRRHRFTDDRGVRIDAAAGDQWLLSLGVHAGEASLPRAHGRGR